MSYYKCRTKLKYRFNHTDLDDIEDIYFPNEGHYIKRSPMRRRYNKKGTNPHVEWYSDLGHSHRSWYITYKKIQGYLFKNIGKKFDDAFSNFLKKNKNKNFHCYGYHNVRSMFLREFEPNGYRRVQRDYYIDDEGLIQHTPYVSKTSKDIKVYTGGMVYILKEEHLLSLQNQFISLFGKDLYNEILSKKVFKEYEINELRYIMHKLYSDFEKIFEEVRRYRKYRIYGYEKWKTYLFPFPKYDYRIIRYGTKEYFQYLREKKQAKALRIKTKKHPDRTEFINTLKTKKLQNNARKVISL